MNISHSRTESITIKIKIKKLKPKDILDSSCSFFFFHYFESRPDTPGRIQHFSFLFLFCVVYFSLAFFSLLFSYILYRFFFFAFVKLTYYTKHTDSYPYKNQIYSSYLIVFFFIFGCLFFSYIDAHTFLLSIHKMWYFFHVIGDICYCMRFKSLMKKTHGFLSIE